MNKKMNLYHADDVKNKLDGHLTYESGYFAPGTTVVNLVIFNFVLGCPIASHVVQKTQSFGCRRLKICEEPKAGPMSRHRSTTFSMLLCVQAESDLVACSVLFQYASHIETP